MATQREPDRAGQSDQQLWSPDPRTQDEISAALGTLRRKPPPNAGWRRILYRATAGRLRVRESRTGQEIAALIGLIEQPLYSDHVVAVVSLKGGVGKTTTTIGVGASLASHRRDRVIAVDTNPDLGNLAQRSATTTQSTVRDLLADGMLQRYSDVRFHTSQTPELLEVLASERIPEDAERFSEADLLNTLAILRNHYNVILADCGTGLSHSAMNGVLRYANTVIVVTSRAADSVHSATATLQWLRSHGHQMLADNAIVVITASDIASGGHSIDTLVKHFNARAAAVHAIPYDKHLAEGAEIRIDLLRPRTRQAFVELAALVATQFQIRN